MRSYTAWRLIFCLLRHPTWQIIVSDWADYPGTNWADELKIITNPTAKAWIIQVECS